MPPDDRGPTEADPEPEQDWGDDEPVSDLGGNTLQILGAFFIIASLFFTVFLGLCASQKDDFQDRVIRGVWLFGSMSTGLALMRVGKDDSTKQEPLILYFMPVIMMMAMYVFFAFGY